MLYLTPENNLCVSAIMAHILHIIKAKTYTALKCLLPEPALCMCVSHVCASVNVQMETRQQAHAWQMRERERETSIRVCSKKMAVQQSQPDR